MIKRFSTAIVRCPCREMVHGLTTADLGIPDFKLASEQHQNYMNALKKCGLQIDVLNSDSRFPDSVFIEDVAVCTKECAIIANPAITARNGEKDGMTEILSAYYRDVEVVRFPGTMEAGDVMMVGNHFFIGISERTNCEGAGQLINILERYGMTGSMVPLKEMLHLKTGVSYLEENNLLVFGEFIDYPDFNKFNRIEVPAMEGYAANSLWINNTVLVPEGFPETRAKIEKAGYPVIGLDVSEFRKLDGGLSCLSLRF